MNRVNFDNKSIRPLYSIITRHNRSSNIIFTYIIILHNNMAQTSLQNVRSILYDVDYLANSVLQIV